MKTMEWIPISQLPIVKGFYYCFIPDGKDYKKHIREYYFDGTDFRNGDSIFFGGGRRITKYISHYIILIDPAKVIKP